MPMNSENIDLIIVRGAPGIGKSSFGRRIKKEFVSGFVVEVDDVRGMINSVQWVQKEEHLNALNATECLIKSYLTAGYKPGIVIDTFNPTKLKIFCQKFTGYKYKILSLYANNEILKDRLLNREKGFKDWDMTKILNDEIEKYRHENEVFLNTSDLSKEQVVQEFLRVMANKNYV